MNPEIFVHLFHMLIVGSLFIYVGIIREKMPSILFPILLGLGLVIIIYHIYKVYRYMKADKPYWVNLIHIILIGPLLVYIGYNKQDTSRRYFEILLMLGFASIGYHGYYLFQ